MRVTAPGITLDLPPGWEAEVDGGAGAEPSPLRTPRTHVANFPLPPGRGDFGSTAVERMRRGDTLICLLEEAPDAARSRLHVRRGLPALAPEQFAPDAMQRPQPGQSGTQVFFHTGRPGVRALRGAGRPTRPGRSGGRGQPGSGRHHVHLNAAGVGGLAGVVARAGER